MLPIRYLMAIMGSIGLAIIYGFKVNVSVAIVAMVNHTAVKLSTMQEMESRNTSTISAEECASSNVTTAITEVENRIHIFRKNGGFEGQFILQERSLLDMLFQIYW